MDKKAIKRARDEAKLNEGTPAEEYLCHGEVIVPAVGDRPARKQEYWDVFTKEQHGYQTADERIPLYPEERTVVERIDWWRQS